MRCLKLLVLLCLGLGLGFWLGLGPTFLTDCALFISGGCTVFALTLPWVALFTDGCTELLLLLAVA